MEFFKLIKLGIKGWRRIKSQKSLHCVLWKPNLFVSAFGSQNPKTVTSRTFPISRKGLTSSFFLAQWRFLSWQPCLSEQHYVCLLEGSAQTLVRPWEPLWRNLCQVFKWRLCCLKQHEFSLTCRCAIRPWKWKNIEH